MTNYGSQNVLLEHAANHTSFTGEDGVLEKIFDVLDVKRGWCVEFGAWDGHHGSNTHTLIAQRSWSSVQIEGDLEKFCDLEKTHVGRVNVFLVNRMVAFEGEDSLDSILATYPIPIDFDLLVIDIDGNDYHIWDSVKRFEPKVVMIEFNASFPNEVEFVQPCDLPLHQGSSLRSIIQLGKQKGYELVATTTINAIFVKKELFHLFGVKNNDIDMIHDPRPWVTNVVTLYDGTLVLSGNRKFIYGRFDFVVEDNAVRLKYRPRFPLPTPPPKKRKSLFRKLLRRKK